MRIIESSFRKLYQEYLESELSVRDFSTNQNFAVSTFYNWKNKLKSNVTQPEFIPLQVGNQTIVKANKHTEVSLPNEEVTHEERKLEFTFPNGTKLQLKGSVDLALLKTIYFVATMMQPRMPLSFIRCLDVTKLQMSTQENG